MSSSFASRCKGWSFDSLWDQTIRPTLLISNGERPMSSSIREISYNYFLDYDPELIESKSPNNSVDPSQTYVMDLVTTLSLNQRKISVWDAIKGIKSTQRQEIIPVNINLESPRTNINLESTRVPKMVSFKDMYSKVK